MSNNWLAFLAGSVWLAAFTFGLFAFANWVQRRDRRRHDSQRLAGPGHGETGKSAPPERKGGP